MPLVVVWPTLVARAQQSHFVVLNSLKGAPATAAGGFGMTQMPFAALGGCFISGRVALFLAPWSAGPKPAAVRFP